MRGSRTLVDYLSALEANVQAGDRFNGDIEWDWNFPVESNDWG